MTMTENPPLRHDESRRDMLARLLRARGQEQSRTFPVSRGQQALWFLHQSAPDSPAYTVVFALRIRSRLDKPALKTALQFVVDRHQQLRANFHMGDDGRLVQTIHGYRQVALDETRVQGGADLDGLLQAATRRPFNLATDPLFRPHLFSVADGDHVLLLCVHHIVYDGWSLWLTLDELRLAYEAGIAGRDPALPPLTATYVEHLTRQEQMIDSPRGQELADFWTDRLSAARTSLDLPFDRPRPPVRAQIGDTCGFTLPPALSARLLELARNLGVTPFSLLLGSWQILLARYSGQETVAVGTRSAGRGDPQMANVVGYFVNPVVVVTEAGGNRVASDLLRDVHADVMVALAHDELPFPTIVERMQLRRDPSSTPLFQTSFVLQKAQRAGGAMDLMASHQNGRPARWAGMQVEYVDLPQQAGQFDLDLEMFEVGDSLRGVLKYDNALFLPETIARLAENFETMLDSLAAQPDQRVDDLPIVSPASLALIQGFSAPVADAVEAVACVHELFERQAADRPDAPALTCGDETLSYAELNRRANRLAHRLIDRGVRPGDLVGLCSDRQFEIVVGILAILKAGAAYLPLDPALPADRIGYIMQDSASTLIVVQSGQAHVVEASGAALVEMAPGGTCDGDWPETNPEGLADLEGLIYVMYTSGTTGRPKGVQLTHRNVARLFLNTRHWYGFDRNDVWTLFHSFAFDVSVWEMWGALTYGGRLVVVPYLVSRTPSRFLDLVRREGVTVLNQSPSAFKLFVAEEGLSTSPQPFALRAIIFAGEPLDLPSLRPWVARHGDARPLLVNMYGITETTVHASYRVTRAADLTRGRSTIGVAIPDLRLDLLDDRLRPVPIGATGEIHVSGPGLSRGYLGRPGLTAEKFVTGADGIQYYRSSDLARYLPDGNIEYLGRNDKQVKIRGFRIELGEIEGALCRHPDVAAAVTIAQDHPSLGKRLVSYVVARPGQDMDERALRAHLAATLPDYMIPSVFMRIDEIPLNGNGKVNHALLPEPASHRDKAEAFVAPRGDTETRLAALWERVLGVAPIGVNDDFFQLGGQSLLAVHLMSETGTLFSRRLDTAILFRNPTIARLAEALDADAAGNRTEDGWSPLVPMNAAPAGQPRLFCVAGGGGSTLYYQGLAAGLGDKVRFVGLQLRGTDGTLPPHTSVEDAATELTTAIRQMQPHGPYLLAGHCFGALVAFEIARRLESDGEAVAHLVVMDAPAPSGQDGRLNDIETTGTDDADWLAKIAEVLAESAETRLVIPPADIRAADDGLGFVAGRIAEAGLLPADAARCHLRGFVGVFQANSRARYAPQGGIRADVTLLRAADYHPDYDYCGSADPARHNAAAPLGWDGMTSGICRTELVPGTHLTMLSRRNSPAVSAAMRQALQPEIAT